MKRNFNIQSLHPDYFNPYNPDNFRHHTESPLKIPRFDYTSALASVSRSMTPAFNFNDFSTSKYGSNPAVAAAAASAFSATNVALSSSTSSSSTSSTSKHSSHSRSHNNNNNNNNHHHNHHHHNHHHHRKSSTHHGTSSAFGIPTSTPSSAVGASSSTITTIGSHPSSNNDDNDLSNYFAADVLSTLQQSAPTVVVGPRPTANGKVVAVAGSVRVVNWTNAETICFLNLCMIHDVPKQMQEPGYRFSKVFHDISEQLVHYGFYRTTTQLKDKYKALKSRYNKGDITGLDRECVHCINKLFGRINKDVVGNNPYNP